VLEDLDPRAFEFDEVAVESADRNGVRGRACSEDLLPLLDLLWIDPVDSIHDHGIRENSHPRICLLEDLQAEKMIGMLMGDVNRGQRLFGLFDLLQHFLSAGLRQLRVHQHHCVRTLDDGRVGPELIVRGRKDID